MKFANALKMLRDASINCSVLPSRRAGTVIELNTETTDIVCATGSVTSRYSLALAEAEM